MNKVYYKVNTRASDSNKDVSIRIRFKDGNIDQATATGEYVKLKHWDLPKQKFRRTSFKGKDQLISKLSKLQDHVLEKAEEAQRIEKGWLVKVVDEYRNPNKNKQTPDLSMFEWIENWIKQSKNKYHTIRAYHTTLNGLKDYRPNLTWDEIDMEFYDEFINYLIEKDYAKNSIGTRIKNLKVFCRRALERNIHNNRNFEIFKKPSEESFNIYLNEEELKAIHKLDLAKKPHLDRVRDMFLIGCWTGSRFSDIHKINEDNIDGSIVRIEQQKGEKRIAIPLHPIVMSIFDKYNHKLPKMISNQKFNEYIKKVCKKAKIKGKESKGITKGGQRQTIVKKRWKMVSSHTARRSFATNLYKSGFPSISIMAITGHKTEKAFLSYIKVNEEEHAEMLAKHWNKLNNDKQESVDENSNK